MQPPKLLDMIRGLIAIPSVSSVSPQFDQSNRAVIDLLASWLNDLGFAVEIQSLSGDSAKANLIATLGSGADGLVLAGHTDTVPYDLGRWQHDPFGGQIEDERLYGLGTADMKSFLALATEAARTIDPKTLQRPLVIVATADEESTMQGAQSLLEAERRLGRYAVIGEPTGLQPVRLHKGVTMEAIHVDGRSGHSSNPALGVNALEGMHIVIGELLRWRAELQERYRNPLFEVAVPTMNLGHIHGGDNPNRICAHCEVHIDLRPLPGMPPIVELRQALYQRLTQALADHPAQLSFTALMDGVEAMETPADAAIVKAAEELTGQPAGAVAFGTEGPFLNRMGMDTVIMGPGYIAQAHQPDEFIALDTFNPTLDLLHRLINRFCIQPQ